MDKIGTFGHIFFHKGKPHIYLVQIGETLYTALIIDKESGEKLNKWHDKKVKMGGVIAQKAAVNTAYRLVLLKTEDFKDDWASLYSPEQSADSINLNIVNELNKEDKEELKKEIMGGDYARPLKEEISAIEVT
jgi:hypothetical protein